MLTWETILTRLLLALLIGGILGAEREYRDKSAGLRTISLICLGSCLFMVVSILLNNGTTDRIASNIVTGIGFLGAGVIFKSEKGVNGITTAATIWATAALGMAIGSGMYIAAAGACLLILVVLSAFIRIERAMDRLNRERLYTVVSNYEPSMLHKYEEMMTGYGLSFKQEKRTRQGEEIHFTWLVQGSRKKHEQFVDAMLRDPSISVFEF